jgi:hypothetical protein
MGDHALKNGRQSDSPARRTAAFLTRSARYPPAGCSLRGGSRLSARQEWVERVPDRMRNRSRWTVATASQKGITKAGRSKGQSSQGSKTSAFYRYSRQIQKERNEFAHATRATVRRTGRLPRHGWRAVPSIHRRYPKYSRPAGRGKELEAVARELALPSLRKRL